MKHTVEIPPDIYQQLAEQKQKAKATTGVLIPIPILVVKDLRCLYELRKKILENKEVSTCDLLHFVQGIIL
jgi:hypothetical protein